jgi:histidyl-tRNA synthetase
MEAANRSGARFAVILGERERAAGNVAVKDLESGRQVDVHREQAPAWLRTRLDPNPPM